MDRTYSCIKANKLSFYVDKKFHVIPTKAFLGIYGKYLYKWNLYYVGG